ncbi:Gfo/Idh/MocA family protein [Hymenobacter jejuensis]|uniref:Gfo/Idh/MocA family oxidoreductase n=1 Tax=Hymenobacter jejuensis TaxID=2502781 RepID=A0A5B8A158_9BACT|nr:Gfo/Idh/MocA family oxidoreductase [Hymenobacter jejuensis]QDA59872.1 Gfo/Idh/MocA family oxidoreductase [Hymenobacter jejuensis]
MRTFNWGIIGLGRIAHKFAESLQLVPNARLYGVASRSLDKAQQFAAQYNVAHAVGSYEELLKLPDLDVVYIATPHSEHHAHTLLCLRAGVPVLCEKAFALNTRQVQEMIATAREKQVFLMEALWTRFFPSTHKALEIIQSGAIGKVVHIAADFGFTAPYDPAARLFAPALAGGSLLDIGIYPLLISKFFLGNPTDIKAAGALTETGVDMNCAMSLAYENGATASLFSTLAATTDTTCTVYGSEGKLLMHSRFHHAKRLTLERPDEAPQDFFFDFPGHGYQYEIEHVQHCLEQNLVESPLVPWQFSLELMQQLDEVRRQLGVIYPGE